MKNNLQLELGFNRNAVASLPPHRQRRLDRSRWWFAQMRAAVDRAVVWEVASPPRPRQQSLSV